MREVEKEYRTVEDRMEVLSSLSSALRAASVYLGGSSVGVDGDELAPASIWLAKLESSEYERVVALRKQLSPGELDMITLRGRQCHWHGRTVFAFEARAMKPGETWDCLWMPDRAFQPERLLISEFSRGVEIHDLKVGNQSAMPSQWEAPIDPTVFEEQLFSFAPVGPGVQTTLTVRNTTEKAQDFRAVVVGEYLTDDEYREALDVYQSSRGWMYVETREGQ